MQYHQKIAMYVNSFRYDFLFIGKGSKILNVLSLTKNKFSVASSVTGWVAYCIRSFYTLVLSVVLPTGLASGRNPLRNEE